MPQRLSRATVATCAVLAVAAFGGAFALAHDGPAKPAPAPASPTALRLRDDPIGELHPVSPLPALIVPRPRRAPAAPAPTVTAPSPVVSTPTPTPAPAPAPTPAPAPKPPPPAKPPVTFDDSG
jgi:hypothetical protein